MIDLTVLAGKYLKEKMFADDDSEIQALANIIYVDSEIGKAQKKISLMTAGGVDDDVNPKTELDLQVICTDTSIAKAKDMAKVVFKFLDGLYDEPFTFDEVDISFSSTSTSIIIPLGNIGGGNYAVNQHFKIIQGDVR